MRGIVLGSGAAKGLAHIGVLDVLHSNGIEFDFVVGCSIGAVIGAFYAAGFTPSEMKEIALDLKPSKLVKLFLPSKPSHAIFNSKRIEGFLRELLPVEIFEELQKPLFVAATSLSGGSLKFFGTGPLIPAIMASISIPVIFPPVLIEGEYFVDGGVLSPLPVSFAREKFPEARIVAVDPVCGENPGKKLSRRNGLSVYESAIYSVLLMQAKMSCSEKKDADVVLEPDLAEFEFYEFHRSQEIIEKGSLEALKRLEEILAILSSG